MCYMMGSYYLLAHCGEIIINRVCHPWSPLLFNIYLRELGKVISNCVDGVKYAVVAKERVMEWKSQAGLLYADNA